MSRHRTVLALFVSLTLLVAGFTLRDSPAFAQGTFVQPVPGQHIYDEAGALTPAQVRDLEQHAQLVVDAGAPVVVYLQAKNASYDQTYTDAQILMEQWAIESSPGAKDGLVFFFNLKPDDLHHGQVVLYAGATHFKNGNLPESELQRIFKQVMKPDLAQGNLAQGISAGLDAAANSLRNGPPPPPPPSRAEQIASDVSSGPFSPLNAAAVILSLIFAWYTRKVWLTRPTTYAPIAATTSPPDNTDPAIVGAVVTGHVRDSQLEATMLDLAHRGALVIESEGKRNARVRLLDESVPRNDVEHRVWESLQVHTDDEGVVSQSNLGRVRTSWSNARDALRKQLEERGLFDPAAKYRRRPVYFGALAMMVLGGIAVAVLVIGKQPWGVGGATLLFLAPLGAVIAMSFYPDTTQAGADLAATWSSYVAGIKRAKKDPTLDVNLDLDDAMPYAVATGVASSLDKRLKHAAEEGYAPAWLGPALYRRGSAGDGYYCWSAFHSAVTPSSSGGSSGGGAAAGGGGAGGSF